MNNNQPTMIDILVETHIDLERLGPGSSEMTLKALSFMDDLSENPKVLDLGCGTGAQTMTLAQNINGSITGVDQFGVFIDIFNDKAKKLGLEDRVKGIVQSMYELTFPKNEFDLIWSEGAVENFEEAFVYWNDYLKKDGYISVTCPSWFTDERPEEIEKFWADAGCIINSIGDNVSLMQNTGFVPVATYILPEKCWTDNYYTPREAAVEKILEKYPGNQTVIDYAKSDKYEIDLYSKYKQYYGYVFYIGKKI